MRHDVRWPVWLLFTTVGLLSAWNGWGSSSQAPAKPVQLYYFFAENCPHCQEKTPLLKELNHRLAYLAPNLNENGRERQGFKPMVQVPRPAGFGVIDSASLVGEKRLRPGLNSEPSSREAPSFDIPFLGRVSTSDTSLVIFTLVLGLVDSFNPRALVILLFLLSLLVRAGSRKTMLLVAGIFVFFSGAIYFLFMAVWFNLFLLVGKFRLVNLIAGMIVMLMAVDSLRDFFSSKQGESLSIHEQARLRLFHGIRHLRIPAILVATMGLAIAANSFKLLCSVGSPMVYPRLLTLYGLPLWQHCAFLALYKLVYMIPLFTIVIIFTVTFGLRKPSAWHGRLMKLFSGVMMLLLGLALVVEPALLNHLFFSIVLFLATFCLTWVIKFCYQRMSIDSVNPEYPAGNTSLLETPDDIPNFS